MFIEEVISECHESMKYVLLTAKCFKNDKRWFFFSQLVSFPHEKTQKPKNMYLMKMGIPSTAD